MAITLSAGTGLLIESSLLLLPRAHQPPACQVCIKWKLFCCNFLHLLACPDAHCLQHTNCFSICGTALHEQFF